MYLNYMVKVPETAGVTRVKKSDRKRQCSFVYYRKKYVKNGEVRYTNKVVGKLSELTPSLMIPNTQFYDYFDDNGERFSIDYERHLIERKRLVKEAYELLCKADPEIKERMAGHEGLIFDHDLSKYSDEEYAAVDHYLYGEQTPETKMAYDYAMLHHQHTNPHHWEYWLLFELDASSVKALEMPYHYTVEMVCDWYSFTMTAYGRFDIYDWLDTNYYLHPSTEALVDKLLETLDKTLKEKRNET